MRSGAALGQERAGRERGTTPEQFIAKWRQAELTGRAAALSHFLDLCEVLGEQKRSDADPKGEWYCLEKGSGQDRRRRGLADVFKRGCFDWEYEGRCRNTQPPARPAQALRPGA